MTVTITLTDEMEAQLQRRAELQRRSAEDVALEILGNALAWEAVFPTPKEIVAKIKTTPPNPRGIRPARGSLAEALRHAPHDPDFDLGAWNREWVAIEAEMKATTCANDVAEGRG